MRQTLLSLLGAMNGAVRKIGNPIVENGSCDIHARLGHAGDILHIWEAGRSIVSAYSGTCRLCLSSFSVGTR
jgi:hypothetical protein